MKLSENEHYLRYMRLRANEDYGRARKALHDCMSDLVAGEKHEASFRAFLLQEIANLFVIEGDDDTAGKYHEEALRLDPTSLLTRMQYAKFLGKIAAWPEAIAECDRIILEGIERPFLESEDDFGSDYYIREARELRETWLKK